MDTWGEGDFVTEDWGVLWNRGQGGGSGCLLGVDSWAQGDLLARPPSFPPHPSSKWQNVETTRPMRHERRPDTSRRVQRLAQVSKSGTQAAEPGCTLDAM